jgi:guanylate kinase
VRAALDHGRDLIFDIDFQGGRALRNRFKGDVVLVFILPPSMEELAARLRNRASDSDEVITRRLNMARAELEHYPDYDYVIVNDDLDAAYDKLRAVYLAQRHRMERQSDVAERLLHEGTVS